MELEDGNRHYGERPRKQEPQSPCYFTGETLYSLACPFVLRDNRLSDPPSFNHRRIKEFPLPSPHIVPPAGKSFPGAKVGGTDGNCTDGNGSFLPRYTVAGRRRWRWLYFSCCFSPRPLPFLAPPSRRRWTRQLRFYPVLGACALEPPQPLVGVEWHPNRVHPALEARLRRGREKGRPGLRWFWEWEKVHGVGCLSRASNHYPSTQQWRAQAHRYPDLRATQGKGIKNQSHQIPKLSQTFGELLNASLVK